MIDTPEQINADYKAGYRQLQEQTGKTFLSLSETAVIDAELHNRHQSLIDARIEAQKQAQRALTAAERTCEVCLEPLPVRKGRAPKRCETCKEAA